MMAEEDSQYTFLDLLPWEDVLYRYVFPCLPLTELFRLRACSKQAQQCITEYFLCCKYLNLAKVCNRITADAFKLAAHNNTRLHSLMLRHCKNWLNDAALMPVFESSRKLRKLDLTGCLSVGNASLQKMAINCHEMKELYLRDCHWVSKEAVLILAFNCKKLEKLDLTGCWELTDDSIVAIAISCQRLHFLSLAKIYSIGDPAIDHIAKESKCLRHLNLVGCWRVTDNAIRTLGEYSKTLRALQVRECRDITEISLARLRAKGIKIDVQAHPWQMDSATRNYLKSLSLQPS